MRQDDAEAFELRQLRAMERPSWNEGRLDDLNGKVDALDRKVDRRFEKVNEEFTAVRLEMKSGFDRLQWTLISAAAAIIAALIAAPHL